jgi:hypothetical protein
VDVGHRLNHVNSLSLFSLLLPLLFYFYSILDLYVHKSQHGIKAIFMWNPVFSFFFFFFFSSFLHGVTPLKFLLKKKVYSLSTAVHLLFCWSSFPTTLVSSNSAFGLYSSSTDPVHVPSLESRYSSTDQ